MKTKARENGLEGEEILSELYRSSYEPGGTGNVMGGRVPASEQIIMAVNLFWSFKNRHGFMPGESWWRDRPGEIRLGLRKTDSALNSEKFEDIRKFVIDILDAAAKRLERSGQK